MPTLRRWIAAAAAMTIALAASSLGDDRLRATGSSDDSSIAATEDRSAWLAKIDERDRECIDPCVGYAPPEFSGDLEWLRGEPLAWESLRGKVVVVQGWSVNGADNRKAPARAAEALAAHGPEDVQIIALHTPDMAASARNFIPSYPEHVAVALDSQGRFCDELGIYKEPVNVVVDRNGVVRFAGLHYPGLSEAVTMLVCEPHDPSVVPTPKPRTQERAVRFPGATGRVSGARDVRGKEAPPLDVERWITDEPELDGKIIIIDIWATWCGPCRQSIPHLNQLATTYPNDLVIVGLSDEPADKLRRFMKLTEMKYAVASDPKARLAAGLRVRTIPHALVISSDGIVRWQGNPLKLSARTVDRIVRADRGEGARQPCDRWQPR